MNELMNDDERAALVAKLEAEKCRSVTPYVWPHERESLPELIVTPTLHPLTYYELGRRQ